MPNFKLNEEQRQTLNEFRRAINMSPLELQHWLETPESKQVGYKRAEGDAGESVGHEAGRHLLQIMRKRKDEYTEEDYQHMAKVVGYVHRHTAQRPEGDITETHWAYSLKNWGHDPVKADKAEA